MYNWYLRKKTLNRIKSALVDKGKTNKWLAKQLGKNPTTISRWCTNDMQPSLETLNEIAKVLKVDMHELIQIKGV